jgi:hypothetical protein
MCVCSINKQSRYTDVDEFGTPIVKVCEDYANDLFDKGYSNCGLNLAVDNPLITAGNPVAEWNRSFVPSGERQVVMPHLVFKNAAEFLNVMKPPYFEGYTIVIEPGNVGCFTSAAAEIGARTLTSAAVLGMIYWKIVMG